jgi:hypothetical protein
MSNLRELTNAELVMVRGGAQAVYRITEPVRNPIVIILEDILKILEGANEKLPRRGRSLIETRPRRSLPR